MNTPKLHIKERSNAVKDVKLSALLEMTKAINNNLSTHQLLDIYQEILEAKLNVGKLILFFHDTDWTCILKYGVDKDFDHLKFEPELLDFKEIQTLSSSKGNLSQFFEIVIPVYHKHTPLAFILLGDIDEEKIEMSKAIKHLPFVQTLTNVMIVAIENKKLYKQTIQKAAVQKELELARDMQKRLFPSSLPNSKELEMAALYLPHQHVGGDYYDVIWLNEIECVFCLGDVSGKGMAAALLMSNLQAALRMLLKYTKNLTEIIINLNQLLCDNTKSENFLSFFIAKYDIITKKLSYINAGHNCPILFSNNQTALLDKGCSLLGIVNPLRSIENDTLYVPQNSTLFLYTDGLTDTINIKNDSISIEEIKLVIAKNKELDCQNINNAMLNYIEEFKGEIPFVDDIAMLTCKFK